jgi:hypothetical protein
MVEKRKKYHLVNWDTVCTAKEKGGLGILNLRRMNISLLTKWLWKLEKEDGLWQTIVKKIHERQALMYFEKKNKETLNFGVASLTTWKNIATTEK